MTDRFTTRHAYLLALFVLFEVAVLWIATRYGVTFSPLLLLSLALASSLGGRAVAYFPICDWLRTWFTDPEPHSAGNSTEHKPRKNVPNIVVVLAELMCCPICAGTWVGLMMTLYYAIDPPAGSLLIYLLGAVSLGSLFTRIIEAVEWLGRLAQELDSKANRENIEAMEKKLKEKSRDESGLQTA